MNTIRLRALSVHLLTATGAVFSMLAIIAAANSAWETMYLWLVVAFAVDGIDGPLARRYHVKTQAAQIDGVLLDLIIDYLTYVFIPAFALFQSGLLPNVASWIALIVITFASALYFADSRMKTTDNSFSGFPGCWNMFAVVCFSVQPHPNLILPLILALALMMFLPVKFIHPVRTARWRAVSLPVALLWTVAGIWATLHGFDTPEWLRNVLIVSALYLLVAGAVQQVIPPKETREA
mgnify:CR=1 FL=1